MKHGVNLPHHEMPEIAIVHFGVKSKVIHDSNVISEVLGCGETGKPTTFSTFWEVDPSTP